VSRQVRAESLPVYNGISEFVAYHGRDEVAVAETWLRRVGKKNAKPIKRLTLCCLPDYHSSYRNDYWAEKEATLERFAKMKSGWELTAIEPHKIVHDDEDSDYDDYHTGDKCDAGCESMYTSVGY